MCVTSNSCSCLSLNMTDKAKAEIYQVENESLRSLIRRQEAYIEEMRKENVHLRSIIIELKSRQQS